MSFPITVNSGVSSLEAPGNYGPFVSVGGNRYLILVTNNLSGTFLSAYESTDGGNTWAEKGAGGRPIVSGSPFVNGSCAQSSANKDHIFTFSVDPGTGSIQAVMFDCSTNTWGSIISETNPPSSIGAIACAYRASDDSIIVVTDGDTTATVGSSTALICCFSVFSCAGGTFGVWTDLGHQDYANPINWQQSPLGVVLDSAGVIRVFMQQITQLVSNLQVTVNFLSPGTFSWGAPLYVGPTTMQVWGAGAGSATGISGAGRGGGGGGGFSSGLFTPVPLTSYTVVVGTGGAVGSDGTASSVHGVSAGGGQTGTNTTGGPGGSGDEPGGTGGNGAPTNTGGGGGGVAALGVPGGNGGTPTPGLGGSPGSGDGGGGATFPTLDGAPGNAPGGGGGGAEGPGISTLGIGADGRVILLYFPQQGTLYNSRMWQQAIHADNSLGILSEITQGVSGVRPSIDYTTADLELSPFDCAAGTGFVSIAFTLTNALGVASIYYGRAPLADPLTFSFTSFDIGASSSGLMSSPALATFGISAYLTYFEPPSLLSNTFVYRIDSGSGSLGTPITLGSFVDPGCRLRSIFTTSVEITFGTPVISTVNIAAPP